MPVDRMKSWIEKWGKSKQVRDWLAENPPPAEWTATPEEYAYAEMPECSGDPEPIDFPLVPEEEEPLEAPVTRRDLDELRGQVARVATKFNRSIKRNRERRVDLPPAPAPVPAPAPTPKKRGGLAALLEPLAKKK